MKYISHVLLSLSLLAALTKTVTCYVTGQDYAWPGIAVLWILSSYIGYIHNSQLEQKIREYERS